MNNLRAAQEQYDNRQPDENELPILSGTIELHPERDNTLEIPVRVEFFMGEVHALWICSITSGNWHNLPYEMADCIGESSTYEVVAYEKLMQNLEGEA